MPNRPHTHKPDVPKTKRPSKRAYNTTKWQKLRKRFLAIHPVCSACDQPSTEVDHIDGNPKNNALENLQAFCKSCHSKKTAAHDGSFGREKHQ